MTWLWFLAGIAWGALATLTLRWTIGRLDHQAARGVLVLLGLGTLLRLLLAAGVLYAAVRQSILAAGLALTGMLVTRWALLLVWTRREQTETRPQEESVPNDG